jgi:hypothetical protein
LALEVDGFGAQRLTEALSPCTTSLHDFVGGVALSFDCVAHKDYPPPLHEVVEGRSWGQDFRSRR